MEGFDIIGTGKAIPRHRVSNEELSKKVDTSDEWIRSRTGIQARHFCEEEKNYLLATEAAKHAIEKQR